MVDPAEPNDIEIRALREDDAEALVNCVRRCYGESYREADFYDAEAIRRLLRGGRLLSVVAAVAEGRIVGHVGTRIPLDGDAVAETLTGIVDPDYRGLGLVPRIGGAMFAGYEERGLLGARHIATGAHDRTQRLIASTGGVATGVLLAHLPADTDYREIQHDFGSARIGAVVYFQYFPAIAKLPTLDVYLPARFAERVTGIHREIGLERRVQATGLDDGETWPLGSARHDARVGVTTLRFGGLADEPRRSVDALLEGGARRGEEVVYADVPLAEVWAPRLIDRLERAGFCFGALYPGTRNSEALRLQRIVGAKIAPERIVVASEGGRLLRDWIIGAYEVRAGRRPGSRIDR